MGLFLNLSVSLALLSLLGANTQGAPTNGWYAWMKCRPDSKNGNCVTKMDPEIDQHGLDSRLPPAVTNEIAKYQSDDGSGTGQYFTELGSGDQWKKDGRAQGVLLHEDGSADLDGAPDLDYADFAFPQKVYHKDGLPYDQELQEENLILSDD